MARDGTRTLLYKNLLGSWTGTVIKSSISFPPVLNTSPSNQSSPVGPIVGGIIGADG